MCGAVFGYAAHHSTNGSTDVIRINAGGPEVTDSFGRHWLSDRYFIDGSSRVSSEPSSQPMFSTQREGTSGYEIPVPNGHYRLNLLFVETRPLAARGDMTITIGDKVVIDTFDITNAAAGRTAAVEHFETNVEDGYVHLNMWATRGVTTIAGLELIRDLPHTTAQLASATSNLAPGITLGPLVTTPAPTTTTSPQTAAETTTTTEDDEGSPRTAHDTVPALQPVPHPEQWNLVAAEDFDGGAVDRSKWALYSGRGNEGVGHRSPEQISVSDGSMHITGQGDVSGGTSMRVDQTYGRWVIRARQDAGSGFGPAILLWPSSNRWPADGEIDIAEIPRADRRQSVFTLHWGAANRQRSSHTRGDFTQWHTWTLEWTPDHIVVWLDGRVVGSVTDPAAIPHRSMHLALQNDVGAAGHWIPPRDSGTPETVSLHVDSVRVYSY